MKQDHLRPHAECQRSRWRLPLAAGVVLIIGCFPSSAQSHVATATVAPAALQWEAGATTQLRVRLEADADRATRAAITVRTPVLADGSSSVGIADATLTEGNAVLDGGGLGTGRPDCGPSGLVRAHGVPTTLLTTFVKVPAGGFGVVDFTIEAAADGFVPWLGMSVSPTVAVRFDADRSSQIAFSPISIGPLATPSRLLDFSTTPRSTRQGVDAPLPVARKGALVRVRGTARGAARGVAIRVRGSVDGKRVGVLGRAKTDSAGRFSTRVRLRRTGVYELWVDSPATATAAYSWRCPRMLRVRR